MSESVTHALASFAAGCTYEQLPPDVIALAKDLTLDTLGTSLAATTLGAGCAEVVAVAQALGGTAESTLLGSERKVSALNAAFANGALAHALNYDAIGTETGHTGVVCFATPFALAEAHAPISGKRFLTAAIVAGEITARLTFGAVHGGRHISPRVLGGQYFGYFGAAAGAAQILGLDTAQMRSTFGIALMQNAGSRQIVIGGDPPAKAIYGAFPNHGGVLAALLAQAGLEADIDSVGGIAGLYGVASDGVFDADAIVAELGGRFVVSGVQFKPWAVSAHVAPFIEAAIDIATTNAVQPEDVASIELTGAPQIVDWFEPLAERRRPSNAASAANSTMFAVAHAIAYGDVPLAAFTAAGLADERVLQLADRITYTLTDGFRGGMVSIRMNDGRAFGAHIETSLGSTSRPLSRERLEAKFRDCCSHASLLSPSDADTLIALIDRLETLDDVAALLGPIENVAAG